MPSPSYETQQPYLVRGTTHPLPSSTRMILVPSLDDPEETPVPHDPETRPDDRYGFLSTDDWNEPDTEPEPDLRSIRHRLAVARAVENAAREEATVSDPWQQPEVSAAVAAMADAAWEVLRNSPEAMAAAVAVGEAARGVLLASPGAMAAIDTLATAAAESPTVKAGIPDAMRKALLESPQAQETMNALIDAGTTPRRVIGPAEYRQQLVRFFVHNEGLRPAELADALLEWQAVGAEL